MKETARKITSIIIMSVYVLAMVPAAEIRDGVTAGIEEQKAETVRAVKGHTEMAMRMMGDKAYSKTVFGIVSEDENLKNDVISYLTSRVKNDETVFGKYVHEKYDSSADYWLVHADGSVSWDGNLNLYMEELSNDQNPVDGLLKDYRKWDELYENSSDGKVHFELDGKSADVDVSELKKIKMYNETILKSALNKKGEYTSHAAKKIVETGHLTYGDALLSGLELTSQKKMPTMIDHYSTRYVLNENYKFAELFKDKTIVNQWTDPAQRNKTEKSGNLYKKLFNPSTPAEKKIIYSDGTFDKGKLLPKGASVYHGEGSFKWTFDYSGKELVLGYDGKKDYYFETDPRYLGTYNFAPAANWLEHARYDVLPYWRWGNTPDDKNLTPLLKRIHPTPYNMLMEVPNYLNKLLS